ncbi:branched-chain amino acid transporter AzlD [Dermacoccus sp. PE3]|uniref:AzlD domain-containing protein n=1 Tax=Dermacoccus sp. PE3 TaxID=1641401 RepID=UPI000642612F|nr:AzlD domain-containing protein [Dermacoccus sp. PE3]KLO62975.1 branched-chain amino acid transporter AzlD [Dermacoccus sp. PE3]
MSTWATVLLASGLSFVLKFIGYLVPPKYLEGKKTSNVVALFPVALLTGLVCVQAFVGDHGKLVLDARAAAALAAVVALLLRAPFIVVVLVAAATAALIRLI